VYEISNTDNKCVECGNYLGYLNPDVKVFYKNSDPKKIIKSNSFFSNKKHPKFGKFRQKCFDCGYSKFGNVNCRPNITASEYVGYLFNENTSLLRKERAITLENMQKKYGIALGEKKFKEYCEKQAYSNSLEYKKEKYGMTDKEFREFNLSRAVTLENMQRKHGIELGTKKFNEYCKKQARNGNKLEYFIEKYGYAKGTEEYKRICSEKSLTLSNFIRKYGAELGTIKFDEYIQGRNVGCYYSKISQKLFFEILEKTKIQNKIYFAENNGEFGIMDPKNERYYMFDFCVPEINKIIEFNGDYWHCNPMTYSEDYIHDRIGLSAKEIWDNDRIKIDFIEKMNYSVFTVWESDYINQPDIVLKQCLTFLEE
jgi:hypothetical protein